MDNFAPLRLRSVDNFEAAAKPMKTIAVVSRKGGSGKTTVAVQLALSFERRGHGVIVADIDPQRSSFDVLRDRASPRLQAIATSAGKLASLKAACGRTPTVVMIIDTPAVLADELAAAVGVSDLPLLVVRPTYIDLAAAAATARQIRQLRKPGLLLLNQAAPARRGVETLSTQKALRAAGLLGLEVSPVLIRARACYQQLLEGAASAEAQRDNAGARAEMAALSDLVAGRIDLGRERDGRERA